MYNGNYFDGKTSRGYAADIDLNADGLHISFTDSDLKRVVIIWDLAQIHKGHFSNNQRVTLKYGESPIQFLELNDPQFFSALAAAYPHIEFNEPSSEFIRSNGFKGIVAVTIGLVVLAVGSYFFVLPSVAEYFATKMSVEMEVKLGDEMYEDVMKNYHIDQRLTKEANEYWRAMHVKSPYLVNITVVHESEANAFALPGGQIIVYDGIIKEMTDYDEFAGLLGHEYSHIKLHHSARMLCRNLAGYIFISILLNDASGTLAILASNANSLKELSYSRQLEHQADEGGYELLQSKNIDPNGMMKLFETLKKSHNSSVKVPEFITTHPLTEERIAYIQDRLKKDKVSYSDEHRDLQNIWKEMKSED